MRANYKMIRLFVDNPIALGIEFETGSRQTHYLANVLRMKEGDDLLVFNGRDGEWRAKFRPRGKKRGFLKVEEQTRNQPNLSELIFYFAPLKHARLDYMIQKATEMGVGIIQPVITQHTQVSRVNYDRMLANAIEAAEQCGVLSIPEIKEQVKLENLFSNWPEDRKLVFCDEDTETDNPLPGLRHLAGQKLAVLVGPEGGFSETERRFLRSHSLVTPIPLGPRILRADTAAVSVLALVQAVAGDWRDSNG